MQKTLEFLNVLQIHGIPKVMEVLTLMDKFEDAKRLWKTKNVEESILDRDLRRVQIALSLWACLWKESLTSTPQPWHRCCAGAFLVLVRDSPDLIPCSVS